MYGIRISVMSCRFTAVNYKVLSHGQRTEGSKLIELSVHLEVPNYYYIYLKESRELTAYSESPVQALQELNGVSEGNTGA